MCPVRSVTYVSGRSFALTRYAGQALRISAKQDLLHSSNVTKPRRCEEPTHRICCEVVSSSCTLLFPLRRRPRLPHLLAGHPGVHRAPEAAACRLARMGVIGLVEKHQSQDDKER
jgi:hypothetical protein